MDLKFYSLKTKFAVLAVLFSIFSMANAQVGWEQVFKLPATNAFHIAKNGNFIISDYQYDLSGGIHVSTDRGETWTKCSAPDYNYNIFVETDEYIFSAGYAGRIARSNDGGLTWEILSYARAVEDLLGEENVDYTTAYAMTIHDGKLFVGDFNGGGVVYSEDNGETWVATDYETLSYGDFDPKLGRRSVENIYSIASYEGNLYAFGVYLVFRYIPETNSWETLRDDSNFMAISTTYQGILCLGRSLPNFSWDEDFIVTLNPSGEWGALPRPETDDNNVRAMHADGEHLFVGMSATGLYHTNNQGATWSKLEKGYPGGTPMQIRTDKEYVYLATYDSPWSTSGISGLWRMALSELSAAGGVEKLTVESVTPNEAVEALQTIEINFSHEVTAQFDPYSMVAMKFKNETGIVCGISNYVAEGKKLTITLQQEITEPGEYTLVIPEGLITRTDDAEPFSGEFNFVVAAAQVSDIYAPYFDGEKTRTDRDIIAVSLTSPSYGTSIYSLTEEECSKDYVNVSETAVFNAAPGETVEVAVETEGTWVHFFVYVDLESDGFTAALEEGSDWKPVGDLMAYSFYNNNSSSDEMGWNSVGDEITGNLRAEPAIPSFAVPAAEGKYRMRIKQDWSNIDPMGDTDGKFGDFQQNGGQIVDVTLNVAVADGIGQIESAANKVKGIYDLSGRKVNRVQTSGIYIVNGKKVFVK